MIKVVGLFKKKDGLSDAEFRDYYENKHTKLFDDYFKMPGVARYVRRYLTPMTNPVTGEAVEPSFDVIMELWCEEEWYKFFFVDGPPADFRALVADDEAKLFEAGHSYMYTVDEHETDLSKL